MAVAPAVNAKLVLGSFDLSQLTQSADWGAEYDELDISSIGGGGFAAKAVGLAAYSLTMNVYQDFAASVNDYLRTNLGSVQVASLAYLGDTAGNDAELARGLLNGHRVFNASVGQVPMVNPHLAGAGLTVARGKVVASSATAITATGNTVGQQLIAVPAGQNLYGAVHVLSASGTTPSATFQMQSSTTLGGAYTNRGAASSAFTAPGSTMLAAAGAITDTFYRLQYTIAGTTPSFSVLAVFAVA
jgi:hypothetical protein